jgi:Uma2 family endonuclease
MWGTEGFRDLRRAVLIDGELVEMPPPDPLFDLGLTATHDFLTATFPPPAHHVRCQQGFDAGPDTMLDPDLAVVVGVPRDYLAGHPRSAALLVEVASTHESLATYRQLVVHVYAAAGVPEYWVLDVVGRQLIVFRDPVADPTADRGHLYATQLTLGEADTVSPQAAPAVSVPVRELLP